MSQTQSMIILDGVIELLSDPSKWTKGAAARKRNRFGWSAHCEPLDPNAEKWCIGGAIFKVRKEKGLSATAAEEVHDCICRTHPGMRSSGGIPAFNDRLRVKHDDVMNVLQAARKAMRGY